MLRATRRLSNELVFGRKIRKKVGVLTERRSRRGSGIKTSVRVGEEKQNGT